MRPLPSLSESEKLPGAGGRNGARGVDTIGTVRELRHITKTTDGAGAGRSTEPTSPTSHSVAANAVEDAPPGRGRTIEFGGAEVQLVTVCCRKDSGAGRREAL